MSSKQPSRRVTRSQTAAAADAEGVSSPSINKYSAATHSQTKDMAPACAVPSSSSNTTDIWQEDHKDPFSAHSDNISTTASDMNGTLPPNSNEQTPGTLHYGDNVNNDNRLLQTDLVELILNQKRQQGGLDCSLQDSHQAMDVLDALMGLQGMELPVDTFPRDHEKAKEALQLNERLQHLVESQLEKINQHILENREMMDEIRKLAFREAKLQREKYDIHRPYAQHYEFFVDAEGNTPFSKEEKRRAMEVDRPRTWTNKERSKLSSGIHSEVQRNIAMEHVARNEPWRVWEVDKLTRKEWENYPVDKFDWTRISAIHVKTKTPMECLIQWTTQDHPSINKLPWKKKESKDLQQLVEKYGIYGKWEQIASELRTNRTAAQCFSHYQADFNARNAKKAWTKEEDQALMDAVALLGDKNWQQVAVCVGQRSGQQCLQRWMKSINPAIRRERWSNEEDAALKASVDVYGVGNWASIQRHIPGRTDMQCRERWVNVLAPGLNHSKFTEAEKIKLVQLVELHGRKWSLIAEHMPGRTDNSCLRQWKRMEAEGKQTEIKRQRKRQPRTQGQEQQQDTEEKREKDEMR